MVALIWGLDYLRDILPLYPVIVRLPHLGREGTIFRRRAEVRIASTHRQRISDERRDLMGHSFRKGKCEPFIQDQLDLFAALMAVQPRDRAPFDNHSMTATFWPDNGRRLRR